MWIFSMFPQTKQRLWQYLKTENIEIKQGSWVLN